MFEIGAQLWISRSHGYLEVCSKSPKVRDTDISLYIYGLYYRSICCHKDQFQVILTELAE